MVIIDSECLVSFKEMDNNNTQSYRKNLADKIREKREKRRWKKAEFSWCRMRRIQRQKNYEIL